MRDERDYERPACAAKSAARTREHAYGYVMSVIYEHTARYMRAGALEAMSVFLRHAIPYALFYAPCRYAGMPSAPPRCAMPPLVYAACPLPML